MDAILLLIVPKPTLRVPESVPKIGGTPVVDVAGTADLEFGETVPFLPPRLPPERSIPKLIEHKSTERQDRREKSILVSVTFAQDLCLFAKLGCLAM